MANNYDTIKYNLWSNSYYYYFNTKKQRIMEFLRIVWAIVFGLIFVAIVGSEMTK